MTWTEGTLQVSDTISIGGGYWGVISFGAIVLVSVVAVVFFSLAIGTLLASTLKEQKDEMV